MADGPLKLRAVDADDVAVLAACLQDALVPVHDMRFLRDESCFVLVANRFRWEKVPASLVDPVGATIVAETVADAGLEAGGDGRFERVHTALSIEHVKRCQTRGFDPHDPADTERLMEILTILAEDGALTLLFAGDAAVRLEVERIEVIVQDVGEPWPTMWRPIHPLDEPPPSPAV